MEKRIQWIKEELLKVGLLYLQGNPSNLKEKIFVECIYCGEQKYILFRSRYIYGCRKKHNEQIHQKIVESLPEKVQAFNYTLLKIKGSYENTKKTKLLIVCNKGHQREVTFSDLKRYPDCTIQLFISGRNFK